MTYDNKLKETGARLDNDFQALEFDIDTLREDIEDLEAKVDKVDGGSDTPDLDPAVLEEINRRVGDIEARVEELEERSGVDDPIEVPGIGSDLEAALWTAFDPIETKSMTTGGPSGAYHYSLGWGPVYKVDERVQFRGATMAAAEPGSVTFEILRLEDDSLDADVETVHATREIEFKRAGAQYVPIETSLRPGIYFVRKDAHKDLDEDEIVGLQRVEGIEPETINRLSEDIPVEWVRGWHTGYRPRDDAEHQRYLAGNWAQNYHYFFSPEFGYGVRGE